MYSYMGSQLDVMTVLFVCCQMICISAENVIHGLRFEQPVLYLLAGVTAEPGL